MAEASDMVDTQQKGPARFNLSDGLGKEDFVAIGSGLKKVFRKFFAIIFFPFFWAVNVFSDLTTFLFSSHAERPLTKEEVTLISSVPLFLTFVGLALGSILGLFGLIFLRANFFDKIKNITNVFGFIGSLIRGLFEFIGLLWGFFYEQILIALKNFIVNDIFKNQENIIPFLALSLIGFLGCVFLLVIFELNAVQKLFNKLGKILDTFLNIPRKIYARFLRFWDRILEKMGQPIMGGEEMLLKYTNKFYIKTLKFIFLFSVLTLIVGLYIFFTNAELSNFDDTNDVLFLIAVLLSAGFFAGVPVAYLIIRFLKSLSQDKYELRGGKKMVEIRKEEIRTTPSSTSSVSTPSKKSSQQVDKTLTAKERAMERRKQRELERKKR